jgi:flavodoxin I
LTIIIDNVKNHYALAVSAVTIFSVDTNLLPTEDLRIPNFKIKGEIMGSIGLFYGSTTGVTEEVAEKISTELQKKGFTADVKSVGSASVDDFLTYDKLILGTSTWGMGDLQDDWESLAEDLKASDLSGKTVAIFGTGDQDSYPDTFVDGVGILYEAAKSAGAKLIGRWSKEGYEYSDSTAEINGELVGLAIDEDNQPDMTDARVEKWVDLLISEL